MIKVNNQYDHRILKYVFVAIPVITGLFFILPLFNFESLWADEFYQAICVRRYKEAPMGILTFFIGNKWTEVFGFSLLNLRILAAVEGVLAITITSIFSYRCTKNAILSAFSFLLACLLYKYAAFPIYNWDSGTYLFDAIAICLMISLISHPSKIKYVLLGIIIGLMTLGRLPSGIFIVFSCVLIFIANKYNSSGFNSPKAIFYVLAGWIFAILLLLTIIYDSPLNFFSYLKLENTVPRHSLIHDGKYLFDRLWKISWISTAKWFPGLGCMLIAVVLPYIRKRIISILIVSFWLIFCLLLAFQRYTEYQMPMALGGDSVVGFALILVYPIYCTLKNKKTNPIVNIKLWGVVAILISMSFGSDGYFERSLTAFVVPILITIVWNVNIKPLKTYIISTFTVCIPVFAIMLSCYFCLLGRKIYQNETYSLSFPVFKEIIFKTEFFGIQLNEVKDAIPHLQKNGTKFAYLANPQLVEVVYGQNQGISFHRFGEELSMPEVWEKNRDNILPQIDAVVYPSSLDLIEAVTVLDDLKNEGFTNIKKIGGAIVMYRDNFKCK